jgi:hypothetical protein
MFVWLSRLGISHFGILDPNFKTGYYTGIGRALHLIDKDANKKEEDDSDAAADD